MEAGIESRRPDPAASRDAVRESSELAVAREKARDERFARLYRELERPARAMVRRAFGSLFSDAEIEDIYGNAWVGTLRALRNRAPALSEQELRKYVLTAVANHASKELRRRGRRPTAPLEYAREIADTQASLDERAASNEQSRLAREVLSTLPERRRAVMMFRYGWGLRPEEVCGLVKGLSLRAYRKEITRGVEEVSAKLRVIEQGRWCEDREPVLRAFATGIADDEQERQAEQHLAHCRPCVEYVAKLSGQLREIGSALVLSQAVRVVDVDSLSIVERVGAVAGKARDAVLGRGIPDAPDAAVSQLVSSGSSRGAGGAGAGILGKLAAFGAAPKIITGCLAGGAAATACVAAGIVPGASLLGRDDERPAAHVRAHDQAGARKDVRDTPPSQEVGDDPASEPEDGGGDAEADAPEPAPASVPEPESPATPQAPAPAQFDPVASPAPSSSSGGGAAPASGSEAAQEFGP